MWLMMRKILGGGRHIHINKISMHVEFWPYQDDNGELVKPSAPSVLSKIEEGVSLTYWENAIFHKLHTSLSTNLQKTFGKNELSNWPTFFKTRDWYCMLQHIIPIAIAGLGSTELHNVIWSLEKLLKWVWKGDQHQSSPRDGDIWVEVLCKLDKELPSFMERFILLLLHMHG